MAGYVLDASALVKAVIPEPHSERVIELLSAAADGSSDVYLPDLALVEATNVPWKRHQRGELAPQDALEAVGELGNVAAAMSTVGGSALLRRSLIISMALGLAVYDALGLACAESVGAVLVTEDRRQAEAASQLVPPVEVELLTAEVD